MEQRPTEGVAFTINFSPRAAYFIKDNLAVGLELTITSNKETSPVLFSISFRYIEQKFIL